jgi:hypothetical protein
MFKISPTISEAAACPSQRVLTRFEHGQKLSEGLGEKVLYVDRQSINVERGFIEHGYAESWGGWAYFGIISIN